MKNYRRTRNFSLHCHTSVIVNSWEIFITYYQQKRNNKNCFSNISCRHFSSLRVLDLIVEKEKLLKYLINHKITTIIVSTYPTFKH